ncbi:MAG: LysR family transcriptional regulator [Dehalococcoidia bacterium]|nr:LysR family transcriptional regulator [Dehalococcoidia bacterium]
MSEINFHRLFIFHTVARLGSFTRAASELGISQPAVSIQVKELERSLDTTLLIRMRSGVSLTDTGETVYDYTRRIFTLADEMTNAIQDLTGLESGRLTIGSSTTPGEYILPFAIGKFRERYPKVEVSLAISNTRNVIDQILSRELDLGMAGAPVDIRGLASFLYVNDEVVLVTAPTHPLARRRSLKVQDVVDEAFLMRETGSATRRAAEEHFSSMGARVRVVMELGSNEAVKRAASAELGVGVVSKFSVGPDVAAGYLKVLSVQGWRCERPLTVFYRDDTHISAVQRAFLSVLRVDKPLPPAI